MTDTYTNIPFCSYTEMTEEEFEHQLKYSTRNNRTRYDALLDKLKVLAAVNDLPVPDRFIKLYEDVRSEERGIWKKKDVMIVIPKLYLQFKNTKLETREYELWQAIMLGVLKGIQF